MEKNKILTMLRKSCTRETCETKELHLLEVSKAQSQVIEQQTVVKVTADAAYDLFRQFVRGNAQNQMDCIIKNIHE